MGWEVLDLYLVAEKLHAQGIKIFFLNLFP